MFIFVFYVILFFFGCPLFYIVLQKGIVYLPHVSSPLLEALGMMLHLIQ